MGINRFVCQWTLDFLLHRSQCVKIGNILSDNITINTGAPQGCKLSPLLYSLFTYDCISSYPTCSIVKFADDTTVAGPIIKSELDYRNQVAALVEWCSDNDLELNVKKTKEMVIDFRQKPSDIAPLFINNTQVEIVSHFTFLGVLISNDLKWTLNVDQIVMKAQQRLFFLRRLKSFHVSVALLSKFYRAVIESILTKSVTVWYGNATVQDRQRLERIVRAASRIVVHDFPTIDGLYNSRIAQRAKRIIIDTHHPANSLSTYSISTKKKTPKDDMT